MHLITMAYPGEAQGVIEKFGLKKIEQDLFSNQEMLLLLTGEGPIEAAIKTSYILGKFQVTEVINLGIAGTLSDKYKIGDIVPLRTIYLVQDLKPQFKTFQSEESGVDCLTSFERILKTEKAEVLKGIGHIVDREAWGVAHASKMARVPFRAYKLISDIAGTPEACELIKENAESFSIALANFLEQNLDYKTETTDVNFPAGFHFTFTTQHKFKTLLKKLSLKESVNHETIINSPEISALSMREISPKQKATLLLEFLEDRLDPTRKKIDRIIGHTKTSFQKEGFSLHIDPQLENPKATIAFEAGSTKELLDKTLLLQKLSLEEFQRLMNGEF